MGYEIIEQLGDSLVKLRERRGIVHNITNYVTVHDCANVILAIGASPIMATHPKEMKEISALSQALVLNIGTIQEDTEKSMILAGTTANEHNVPIVFDPVGAGATALRRHISTQLPTDLNIAVIRCNRSEIMAIYNTSFIAAGVDAVHTEDLPVTEAAITVAKRYNTVVAVTGAVDIVTDGIRTVTLHNGVDILPMLTGTGCMTTALVGAYCTVNDPFISAVAGITTMSIVGEIAASRLTGQDGLGTFAMYLHDGISNMTAQILREKGKIETVLEF